MIVDPKAIRAPPRGELGLVPLINVVFLLLTFFMLAGEIHRSDAVRVEPPVSASEAVPDMRRVELLVDMDGSFYLDGARVEASALPSALTAARQPPDGGAERPVLVKVDADLPVQVLQSALGELRRSGVAEVALATTRELR